jgi:hypothetical protein
MLLSGLIPEAYPRAADQRELLRLLRHRTTLVRYRTTCEADPLAVAPAAVASPPRAAAALGDPRGARRPRGRGSPPSSGGSSRPPAS